MQQLANTKRLEMHKERHCLPFDHPQGDAMSDHILRIEGLDLSVAEPKFIKIQKYIKIKSAARQYSSDNKSLEQISR